MRKENGTQQEAANAFCYPQSTDDFLFFHTRPNFYRRNLHDIHDFRTKLREIRIWIERNASQSSHHRLSSQIA